MLALREGKILLLFLLLKAEEIEPVHTELRINTHIFSTAELTHMEFSAIAIYSTFTLFYRKTNLIYKNFTLKNLVLPVLSGKQKSMVSKGLLSMTDNLKLVHFRNHYQYNEGQFEFPKHFNPSNT